MNYTPVTTKPLNSQDIVRVANQVAQQEVIGDDNTIAFYIDTPDNYTEGGVKAMIANGDFNPDTVSDYFFEDQHLEPLYTEDFYRNEATESFRNALTDFIEETGSDAPYNEVQAQISKEAENFWETVQVDWSEAMDLYRGGARNFLNRLDLSPEEAESVADGFDEAYMQYKVYKANNIVSTIHSEYGTSADVSEILARATGRPESEIDDEIEGSKDAMDKLLQETDNDDLAEAFAYQIDAYYENGIVVETIG